MNENDVDHDRYEHMVLWVDGQDSGNWEAPAAAWLTRDREDNSLTFHTPTHSEEVASIGGARMAAVLWSMRTGIRLEGPFFEHFGVDPPYIREAVERALKRESDRSRMIADRERDVGYER